MAGNSTTWATQALSNLASLKMGQAPDSAFVNESGDGLPFVQGNAEFGHRHPTPKKFCTKPSRIAEPEDILISVRAPVGALNIADRKLAIGRGLAALTVHAADREFLWHALARGAPELAKVSQGSTFTAINRSDLEAISIPTPPLPEQRKIASILSSVDDTIEKSSAVIDQLEVVKKALMQELLTRGLPGRHTRFKQTEIGEVPEDWSVSALSSAASVFDPNPSHRYPTKRPTGIPLASTENFFGGERFDLSGCPQIDEQDFLDQKQRCNYESDDVVFARKGRIGFARPYGADAKAFSHTVVTLKANRARYLPSFLLWVIRSSSFLGQLQKTMNSNSGVPTLGVKVIASTLVPIPPVSEQHKISVVLDPLSERAANENDALLGLRFVKTALLTVLLSGEVRVPLEQEAA